jgi:glutaredoxin
MEADEQVEKLGHGVGSCAKKASFADIVCGKTRGAGAAITGQGNFFVLDYRYLIRYLSKTPMNASAFRVLLCLLCMLPFLPGPAAAEVYRWTDAEGKVHFGDRKPEGEAAGRVESFQGKGSVSFIDGGPAPADTPATGTLRIFTTQWCSVCKKAKAWLRKRGTRFEELDVEASAEARAEYEKLGGRGVPLILLGNRRMNGFDAGRLQEILEKAM